MMERKRRKIRIGRVVSNRMQKTIVVAVQRLLRHSVYQKTIKKFSKLYAHDEKGECQIGDLVKVMETRPLSKLKRWRLLEIVEKAK
ncbi:MAG: 30S ribosomal protein S17 [Candidatus Zixiibacteriota bacterium]